LYVAALSINRNATIMYVAMARSNLQSGCFEVIGKSLPAFRKISIRGFRRFAQIKDESFVLEASGSEVEQQGFLQSGCFEVVGKS